MTTTRQVVSSWWPLAGSWLLMGLEMPAFNAAASRLADTEINLTAFNSVVYPISMVVEGPIVMLLAAATALVHDRQSYRALRRFTLLAAGLLTLLHALIAFTPIYDVIARDWIRLADASLEPGRLGLRIMLPWSAAIAYRRFQQGVLIRHGDSRAVVVGTWIRLCAGGSVLVAGVTHGGVNGIVIGAAAISTGVLAEAAFAAWRTRQVVRTKLQERDTTIAPLTARDFIIFYTPLALTPLITLAMQPITAAALWRLPEAGRSSASWGAVYGFIFLFRAMGFAFQEVTVTLSRAPGGPAALRRFAIGLATTVVVLFGVFAGTPLSKLWFDEVLALPPHLSQLATAALLFGVAMPTLAVLQNYFQGRLVHARRTRPITEAVMLYLVVAICGFAIAIDSWDGDGIRAALLVLTIAGVAQLAWLCARLRSVDGRNR